MKRNKLFNTLLVAGGIFLVSGAMQSCEDYLTVYPTDQITEEQFWQDKNDMYNMRAAAYQKLTTLTSNILIWGELRSDNLTLNKMDNTSILHLQNAVLMPTESMFSWSGFYTGINYCNMVLEHGQKMMDSGIDPSLGEGEWKTTKAEMQALRALYYFYLVRAFRDVPYVSKSISTDAEAIAARDAATPGVAILSDLIETLEEAKNYAGVNIGTTADKKGRFTKRSVHTLLADLYLWRGCLLKNFSEKGGTITSLTDVVTDSLRADSSVVIKTADGRVVNASYVNELSKNSFKRAIELCDTILGDMLSEYQRDLLTQSNVSEELRNQKYPLIQMSNFRMEGATSDEVYARLFGSKNSTESILELQYDGTNNINSTLYNYLTSYDGTLRAQIVSVNPAFVNATEMSPDRGFGKTDMRLLETMQYSSSSTVYPYMKNVASSVMISDITNMAEGGIYNFRMNSQQNANWPIYRLSDLMLIKAEAVARYNEGSGSNEDIMNAFDAINYLYKRYNPSMSAEQSSEFYSDRVVFDHSLNNYYGKDKTAADLLRLVYRERQREFVGEGKYWFDIVRQAEAANDPTSTLQDYMMALPSAVKSRLKQLVSLYNPIYNEEIKVNGVENGGGLVQNPVWERYTKK